MILSIRFSVMWVSVLLICSHSFAFQIPKEPPHIETIKKLKQNWRDQDSQIINGKFRVRLFRAMQTSLKGHTVESLRKFLNDNPDRKSLEKILDEQFLPEFKQNATNFKSGTPHWGKVVEMAFDGSFLRNSYVKKNQPKLEENKPESKNKRSERLKYQRVFHFSPKGVVDFNPQFGTFSIHTMSMIERFDKYQLKLSPQFESDANFLSVADKDPQLLEVELNRGRKILVDKKTSFVRQFERVSGKQKEYRLYCQPFEVEPNVWYPRVQLKVIFENDVITQFFLTELLDASINLNLDPGLFKVVGIIGQKVIDMRNGEDNVKVYDILNPDKDVFTIVETQEAQKKVESNPNDPEPNFSPKSDFSRFFFFFLLCLGAAFVTWLASKRGKLFFNKETV